MKHFQICCSPLCHSSGMKERNQSGHRSKPLNCEIQSFHYCIILMIPGRAVWFFENCLTLPIANALSTGNLWENANYQNANFPLAISGESYWLIFRYANVDEFISFLRAAVFLHTTIQRCIIQVLYTHTQAHTHTVTCHTFSQTCTLIETLYLYLISMQRGVPGPMRQVYPYELNACNPSLTSDTLIHMRTHKHTHSMFCCLRVLCPWNQVEHLNKSIAFRFGFTFRLLSLLSVRLWLSHCLTIQVSLHSYRK